MFLPRLITALVLVAIVVPCILLLDAEGFRWFVAVVIALAGWEWANLVGFTGQLPRIVTGALFALISIFAPPLIENILLAGALVWWCIAFVMVISYPLHSQAWRQGGLGILIGAFVIVPFGTALNTVRAADLSLLIDVSALWFLVYMLAIVWAADTGAYFAGKAFGKRKLAPNVSPGKSWEGVIGGLVTVVLFTFLAAFLMGFALENYLILAVFAAVAAVASVVGDLTESMFKRSAGLKDSSALLPGHGGILDRVDGLTAGIPVFVCLAALAGWV